MNDDLSTSEKLVKKDVEALKGNTAELRGLRKRFMGIFGEHHHEICDGLNCICKETTLSFIQSELTRARGEGYEEGYSDGLDECGQGASI